MSSNDKVVIDDELALKDERTADKLGGEAEKERSDFADSRKKFTEPREGLAEFAERAGKSLSELLKNASLATGLACLDRACTYFGERAGLLGFDKNSGAALIARTDHSAKIPELREFSESNGNVQDTSGRKYLELEVCGQKLYRDGNGAIFSKVQENGKSILQEMPGLRSVSPTDKRLSIEKSNDGVKGTLGVVSEMKAARKSDTPGAFLEHLAELTERAPAYAAIIAIAQSNEFATKHQMSTRLEDGFRSAGQFREFASDGSFAAADRAATVVDRKRDSKLNQYTEDAKKQFGDLPPPERAKALADYVNKIMGPADGNERALDERYRKRMQDNAGKEILLSDFAGEGACTQRALLLKVLSDEMGLNCSIVRGNGGAHVWNTFQFENGKPEIFDARARLYGAESSEMHRPIPVAAESFNGRDFVAGQQITADGKNWRVDGYDAKDGKVLLSRQELRNVTEADLKQMNPGREINVGEKYTLKSANGKSEQWTFEGKNEDASLKLSRSEEKAMARKELAESVLELAGSPSADLKYLQDNWKKLVEDNPKLSDRQRADLKASLDLLDASGNAKLSDFRKLVDELGRLQTSTVGDVQARVDALAKIANTVANYPEAVHLPIDRVIGARSIDALTQVADSFAQSAPHEVKPPKEVDGTLSKTGDGYEHAASQALQRALQDPRAMAKLPAGDWVFVPASKGSVADDLKIDGMLVDMKTGKVVFVDFAMHQTGRTPYATLAKKLSPSDPKNKYRDGSIKHPWALTLDNDSIGWDPATGKSSGTIDPARIGQRVASFMGGTQPAELGLPGLPQAKPTVFEFATIKAELGGTFPGFGPVKGKLEADVLSRESGKTVKTRQDELADIAAKKLPDQMKIFGLAADAASNAAQEMVDGSNFFNDGLRAAVEAEKFGAADRGYGKGNKVPELKLTVGNDHSADLPEKYKGKKYIGISGDDTVASNGGVRVPTDVRIYENGDVVVRPGGGKFHCIGNIREVGDQLGRELQRNGVDPKNFDKQIRELARVSKNFAGIEADINAVGAGTMTQERFWSQHPELRLLADGVQHNGAKQRAAQEARTVYEARQRIDSNPALAKLVDAEKNAIAQKYVDLDMAGHKRLSLEQVRNVMQLEKLGMKTADAVETARFQQAVGKDAERWTASEIKRNFDDAKSAQAKDFPSLKDLAEVYKVQRLQSDLKVDASTAQSLHRLKSILPDASSADLQTVKEMYDSMKTAGLRAISLDNAAKVFSKHGALSQAEIAEMAKLAASLKTLKPEELAGVAVRNAQVESLYSVDPAKADAIRAKVLDLLKTGAALENVHDAAALMTLKNLPQADALELAKTVAELRGRHHIPNFAEMADTASVLHNARKLGADSIKGEFETLLHEGLTKHGADLNKLKTFLQDELFHRGTGDGAYAAEWSKVYDAIDGCKDAAAFAKLMGLPADAVAQKAALESYMKLFRTDSPAAVAAYKLSEIDKKGLDLAKELKRQAAGLELKTQSQVSQFLKSCLDEIDSLPMSKKWSDADRDAYAKLVERYAKGEAAALAAVNTYLDLKLPAALTAAVPSGTDTSGRPTATLNESMSIAELERRMSDPVERARVAKRIEDEGPIRNTLAKAGMSEERARKLEKDLLSEKEEVRKKAQDEIAKYYESRGRGGFRGFAKEAAGRLGALVMVAAVVLPWLLSDSASGGEPGSSATWSGGGRR